MSMRNILVLALLLLVPIAYAQDTSDIKVPDVKKPDVKESDVGPVDTKHIFIIFETTSPNKIIVLDDDGKWIPQIKSVNIKMAIGEAPVCVCTMWNGFFKPSKPAVAEYPMKQARSVTEKEFQTMIDELQANPFAIR